jgi:hypothetical protein
MRHEGRAQKANGSQNNCLRFLQSEEWLLDIEMLAGAVCITLPARMPATTIADKGTIRKSKLLSN